MTHDWIITEVNEVARDFFQLDPDDLDPKARVFDSHNLNLFIFYLERALDIAFREEDVKEIKTLTQMYQAVEMAFDTYA